MRVFFRVMLFLILENFAIANNSFPLIIMGGVWSPESKPTYSNLSRVCDIGFTHIFSYITEPNVSESRSVATQVNVSKQFSDVVKKNCPQLGLVMGIPSEWIYNERFDLINDYIESLHSNNVKVDYWLSDEVINSMMNSGVQLTDAVERASYVMEFVESISNTKYIWIEPGNYGNKYSNILSYLGNIPFGIKSYDQYIVSSYGSISMALDKFNLLNSTLVNLNVKSNVFPVCDISKGKDSAHSYTQNDLDVILVSLLMNHASGFVFWEERWTDEHTLKLIRNSLGLINKIQEEGVANFTSFYNYPMIWKFNQKFIVINNTESIVNVDKYISKHNAKLLPGQIDICI